MNLLPMDHGADPRSGEKDRTTGFVVRNDGDDREDVSDGERTMDSRLRKSTHRDGSIYTGIRPGGWKSDFRVADRSETRLEAMALSAPTPNCNFFDDDGTCSWHYPTNMLQILSLKVARIPVDAGGSVELYGYVAARDDLDPFLNYIVNISRDDPIVVEQGSLINITGSKRGIEMMDEALIEYDMRIKNGEQEQNDLQLLDGASALGYGSSWDTPFTLDTPGESGVIDITLARIRWAVEATIEVSILEVQNRFNLSLGCFTSGLNTEIRLFDGAIAESRGLKRYVVAVASHSFMELKFNVGAPSSSPDHHCCSFNPESHGHVIQKIETKFAPILVKVTWSTLPSSFES